LKIKHRRCKHTKIYGLFNKGKGAQLDVSTFLNFWISQICCNKYETIYIKNNMRFRRQLKKRGWHEIFHRALFCRNTTPCLLIHSLSSLWILL
jgi:hypothetical protein